MASKIRVLNDHTINKIAAGEVIENPASVVKELVENSIDAGAKDICVEIKGGGRQLIRISDDGCGMNADDAILCLERHATSKIRDVEDIHTIMTMGFRGEAIPSIASISKFTLLTCPQPENKAKSSESSVSGTMVIVDGGKVISCSPAARSPGTTVEVKSLFFNVPVRKKFLKSPAIDANEILKTLSLIALGYPDIKFQLMSDGKQLLMAPLSREDSFVDRLKARIEVVLGQDFVQNTVHINREGEGMHLQGFVGYPSYTRHNRTGQYLFINNRGVFSPLVAYAVKEGYGTALPSGRHPVFVLHLSLCGSLVDVNVHPQKREVRLRQEQVLKDLIIKGIEQALQHTSCRFTIPSLPEISPVFAETFQARETPNLSPDPDWVFQPKPFTSTTSTLSTTDRPTPFVSSPPITSHTHSQPPEQLTQASLSLPKSTTPPRVMATIPRYILLDGSSNHEFISKGNASGNSGLFLVDQKAAHSRIIFEKLQQNEEGQHIPQQSLLIPITIEVSSFDADILREAIPSLNKMGIQIQEFGSETFLVDAVPQMFCNSDIKGLITDILNDLRDTHGDQPLENEKNKRIALAASRTAVSHDRRLSIDEAQALINQLTACRHPYQCPQGKPILLQLSHEELSKQFQRN